MYVSFQIIGQMEQSQGDVIHKMKWNSFCTKSGKTILKWIIINNKYYVLGNNMNFQYVSIKKKKDLMLKQWA